MQTTVYFFLNPFEMPPKKQSNKQKNKIKKIPNTYKTQLDFIKLRSYVLTGAFLTVPLYSNNFSISF